MAHGPKSGASTKGRRKQALEKQAAAALKRAPRNPNPARHDWLARHRDRQQNRCAYCGIPMLLKPRRGREKDRLATLDHVVPLARGGADSEANTVAACTACNTAKGDWNAMAYRNSGFCRARKAYAATIPEPISRPLIIEIRRPKPKPPTD